MKKNIICTSFIVLLAVAACNQNPDKQTDANAKGKNQKCYLAVSEKDSAMLSIGEKDSRIVGDLAFNFAEKDDTQGTVSGEFIGDTLFVEYAFEYKGVKYSNPQVFLKKRDSLVQGHGDMRTTLGRTYFEDHSKIMFDAFVFEPSDCN